MRLLAVVLLFATTNVTWAFPYGHQRPRTFLKEPQHPDRAVEAMVHYLYTNVQPQDRQYFQGFHFLTSSEEDLEDDIAEWLVYLHMTSSGPTTLHPFPIDKARRVWLFDFREANQNREAWHAVVTLDATCRQPQIHPTLAEALREGIGVNVDKKTFHCEGMIPAVWFTRQVKETELQDVDNVTPENIVYYNLLYATERFGSNGKEPQPPKEEPWPGGPWTGDDADRGRIYPKGAFMYTPKEALNEYKRQHDAWEKHKNGFIDRNFPRDLDDFQLKWGVKAVSDYLIAQRLFARNGTIVAGYFNDKKAGSYVAFHDRILSFQTSAAGDVGISVYMRTQDFRQTAGRRNIVNFPLDAARDNIQEDAGEHIAMLPNGFPTFLLTGAAKAGRKRVESGDPHVVFDKLNGGFLIVQTLHKCVSCHYPSDMVLAPSNDKIAALLKKDNRLYTKSKSADQAKQAQVDIDKFFFDGDDAGEGWKWKLKVWREPYKRSLARATRSKANPDGWTGSKMASYNNYSRDRYDAPLGLEQASIELGYPKLAVLFACAQLGLFDAAQLLLDGEQGVPRDEWDNELFTVIANVLALDRDIELGDPLFKYWFPDLERETYK